MAPTSRKRVRYTFDVYFTNEEQKESFKERLKIVRRLLTPPGCMSLDNFGLMESMFDIVEREVQEENMDSTSSEEQHLKSFMRDSGKILFKLIVSLPVSSNIQQEFTLETPIQTTSSFL